MPLTAIIWMRYSLSSVLQSYLMLYMNFTNMAHFLGKLLLKRRIHYIPISIIVALSCWSTKIPRRWLRRPVVTANFTI